jgi:hypothetical protein
MVAVAIALGLAVGAALSLSSGTRSVRLPDQTTRFAAFHETIETHRAAVVAGADRRYYSVETHRTQVANAAALGDLPITRGTGRAYSQGIVLGAAAAGSAGPVDYYRPFVDAIAVAALAAGSDGPVDYYRPFVYAMAVAALAAASAGPVDYYRPFVDASSWSVVDHHLA